MIVDVDNGIDISVRSEYSHKKSSLSPDEEDGCLISLWFSLWWGELTLRNVDIWMFLLYIFDFYALITFYLCSKRIVKWFHKVVAVCLHTQLLCGCSWPKKSEPFLSPQFTIASTQLQFQKEVVRISSISVVLRGQRKRLKIWIFNKRQIQPHTLVWTDSSVWFLTGLSGKK